MKIYLLGAANPETIRMIHAVHRSTPNVEFSGFLDNDSRKKNSDFYGFPVLGGLELVKDLAGSDVGFVNLITGNTRTRSETSLEIVKAGGRLVNFIHPSIDLTMSKLGVGVYLQEAVIVQAGVEIGDNTAIHMGALIAHETKVGKSVFIAPAVSVAGCCRIGDGVFIGTNATILPRINIGNWVTIGAGTVILKDVPDYSVMFGNPGRVIKVNKALGLDVQAN